jgi:hypothetical protein
MLVSAIVATHATGLNAKRACCRCKFNRCCWRQRIDRYQRRR